MELRLPLEVSPGREAACRAVFGTWGFFRTMQNLPQGIHVQPAAPVIPNQYQPRQRPRHERVAAARGIQRLDLKRGNELRAKLGPEIAALLAHRRQYQAWTFVQENPAALHVIVMGFMDY